MSASRTLLVAAGLALALAGGGALWLQGQLYRGEEGPAITVDIPTGTSLDGAARRLVEAGVHERSWPLRLLGRLRGDGARIQAGRYRLARGQAPARTLEALVAGRVELIPFTVPEGWHAARIVALAADSLGLDRARLDSLVATPTRELRARAGVPAAQSLEGYLYPETYALEHGLSEAGFLAVLLDAFSQAVPDSFRDRADAIGLGLHGAVTLASIVEAEAVDDAERDLVAAVYHNRLRLGRRLEADPTVAYATGKQGQRLLYRDLAVDSPYNTYQVEGLPPGPINSPGLASLHAALWPREGFDAIYFVADGQGGHIFSATWEEHSEAVRRYRALMRQRRGP